MKFILDKTSSWSNDKEKPPLEDSRVIFDGKVWTIEINTLEELIELLKSLNHEIVLSKPEEYKGPYPILEIYDDYRE